MENLFDNQTIEQVLIEESMQTSYLDYSMSVIIGRALPDARDGLKPVHRRILYAMEELNLTHKANYKKSARIVGDVIGKYHPHGDSAVYDALVRMAQEFSMKIPLIDGQGNFGSIDGDNAAAMRYCVVGDTRVKSDRGLIKIKDIVKDSSPNSDNDINLKVLSINSKRVNASKFFNSGIHDIYTLKTEEGFQIEGSGNHPILVLSKKENGTSKGDYKWKELQKISPKETVLIDKSQLSIVEKDITQKDLDLAFILSLTILNGELKNGEIKFVNSSETVFNKFVESWIRVFGKNFKTSSKKDLKSNKNIHIFSSKSEDIDELFNIKFDELEIPDFIFQSCKKVQQTFLHHLFDMSEKKQDKNSTICYKTSSEKFVRDIQILLLEFGIIGKISDKNGQLEIKISDKDSIRNFHKNIKKIEFTDEVSEDKTVETFSNILNENYYFATVESCEITKKDYVYSIKVDSSCHSFIANGFVNHNTEARMTKLSEELLKDIDKETVDFTPNYDDSLKEPAVLPSKIPNLLLNGSSGIAVGMATNIPPHRLSELIDAHIAYLNNPDISIEELLSLIPGPDFPTGGVIFGKKGIVDAYKTGRGRIKIRAKVEIEKYKSKEIIVIKELPYQVNKARVIETIATLVKDKQINGISEVRDESDRDGIRVVIELKKDAISDIILNHLYKSTQLQITFGIIMLAIVNKEPKVLNLKSFIKIFIAHRKTVIIRRTIFDLKRATSKAHILEGLKIAVDKIDEVVKIIRLSGKDLSAKDSLINEFNLSDNQAQAILEMKLRRLTALEMEKIDSELAELSQKIDYLNKILESEELIEEIIKDELTKIKGDFTDKRKTQIVNDFDDINVEDLIPNEFVVVTITHRGYIKRVSLKQYDKQKRGGKGKTALTTYDDDFIEMFFTSNTHDTLMFITDRGQLYWLKVYKIPEGSRTAKGKAVVNLINLQQGEKIKAILATTDFDENKSLVFFTKNGIVKRTNLSEYSKIRSSGVRAINLDEDDEVVTTKIVDSNIKWLFIVTKKGQCIRFKVSDAREIGRVSRGVTGIKFKIDGDSVCGGTTIKSDDDELLIVSEKGLGKRTEASEYREQRRAGTGVIAMKLTNRTGDIVGVVSVENNKDLMSLTSIGKMIRVDMKSIRKAGRNTSGVKIVTLNKGDKVVSIAKCPKEEQEDSLTPEGVEAIDEVN